MPGKVVELMGSSRASDTIQTRSNFEQQRYQATNESKFGCNLSSNEAVMLPQFGAALTT